MKSKKGFTLVELLAVIAILAILVIIALPNIMSLFNEAKKNSFTVELKNIYKAATQEFISDSMFVQSEKIFARGENANCGEKLKLSGRNQIEYYIKINKAGKVTDFEATDNTYQYSYHGPGLTLENIDNVISVSEITDDNKLSIVCRDPGSDITVCYYTKTCVNYSRIINKHELTCEQNQTIGECFGSSFLYTGNQSVYLYADPNGSSQTILKTEPVLPATSGCYSEYLLSACACLDGDSEIEVYDKKKKKKLKKKLKDITYDDLILCWDFDKGKFTYEKPLWIMKPQATDEIIMLSFDDGSELKVVGNHRIYDVDNNTFISCKKAKVGLKTFNSNGKIIKLINTEYKNEWAVGYNLITKNHINMFANGILTSQGSNNIYEFNNMKFVKVKRESFTDDELSGIEKCYIEGLRLKEWNVLDKGNREETLKDLYKYLEKLNNNKK